VRQDGKTEHDIKGTTKGREIMKTNEANGMLRTNEAQSEIEEVMDRIKRPGNGVLNEFCEVAAGAEWV
jgi:hypothetical protein